MFNSNASSAAGGDANYIEDVFSTWLYAGNGTVQTVTNGIDLAGDGGLVWIKDRAVANHGLVDTVRGVRSYLSSDSTAAAYTNVLGFDVTAFNSNGFTLGPSQAVSTNTIGSNYVSWTFRKQPKFFDVVTYTGNGATSRTISHNLGSAPGVLILKNTSNGSSWSVFHRSLGVSQTLLLNDTTGSFGASGRFGSSAPTATTFDINDIYNTNGESYVAYLFAHNAGGFGLTGTDNVISCGSYTGNSGTQSISLGYEPQWLLIKKATASGTNRAWWLTDTMRGFGVGSGSDTFLFPNSSAADSTGWDFVNPTATGFDVTTTDDNFNTSGITYIYIAIRRGPMKVPTDGTKVFSPFTTAAATGTAVTTNFPVDFQLYKYRAGVDYWFDVDRLRGVNSTTTANSTPWLDTTSTTAEATATNVSRNWGNTGFEVPGIVGGASNVFYSLQRAPGFFDEVCYTGNVTTRDIPHNLGVAPELVIGKRRSGAEAWYVWCAYAPDSSSATFAAQLNSGVRYLNWGSGLWGNFGGSVNMNATTYSIGSGSELNQNASTNVTYLFATCPGVSKVGSYTGTATTQQINCGFTAGARFVLIKRTDSTGDWYVWDSARGIVAGNDPYLLLNSTAAEVTSTDYVDTYSAGFELTSTAPAALNASGGSYVFLAIA